MLDCKARSIILVGTGSTLSRFTHLAMQYMFVKRVQLLPRRGFLGNLALTGGGRT